MTAAWWQWPLDVVLAWLMPWRAVRTIRGQRQDMRLLIRMLALDVLDDGEPLGQTRMGGWWNLPHPLAVGAVALMPWRAVAGLRSQQRAFHYVCDKIIVLSRQDEARGRRTRLSAPPKPRHLTLVK